MARRRAQGAGSVFYDQTAKSWVAVVSLGVVKGRRIRRKVRAATEQRARAELERLRRVYRAGGTPPTATLDEYLRRWISEHEPDIADSTFTSYSGHIDRHISPLLGGIRLIRLQAADVRRLIADRLDAGLSPATVGRIVTTLRIALKQAVKDQSIPDNPAAAVQLPRVVRKPIRALTAAQARRIREAVRGDPLEPIYVLLMGTGMRAGEACQLDWRDIDFEAGTAFIREGKTARSIRTVYLSAPVVMALRMQHARTKRNGDDEPVFLGTRTGERLRPSTVYHAFRRLLKQSGLPRMRVHDLRHGYATRAAAMGASIPTIADNLGHANPSITANIYAHAVPADQRQASDLVGSELA